MPAAPGTLEQLARDTAQIADPETALNALGVTHKAARDCLQTTMPGIPLKADSSNGSRAAPHDGVSPHARRILEGSLREALQRHEGYIGVEHLLLSLLSDSRNGAVQTLETLKATPNQVRQQLNREWQKLAAPTPSGPPG